MLPIPKENSHECIFSMEDGQNTPSTWRMDRTPQNQPRTDSHYVSVIGINFPTPFLQPSGKVAKH